MEYWETCRPKDHRPCCKCSNKCTTHLAGLSNRPLCDACFGRYGQTWLARWLPEALCETRSVTSQYQTGCTLSDYTKVCSPRPWKTFFESQVFVLDEISRKLACDADAGLIVTPQLHDLYRCLTVEPTAIRVLVLVGGPYKHPGEANGVALSVNRGIRVPPALANVHTELKHCGFQVRDPSNGSLAPWIRQGVLLLNTSLTTTVGVADAHAEVWTPFVTSIVDYVLKERNVVGLLLGSDARGYESLFQKYTQLYLSEAHPNPVLKNGSRGFLGSRPFSRTNELLRACDQEPIDWNL